MSARGCQRRGADHGEHGGAHLRIHGILLACELAETAPPIAANPYSLEEVLVNLISQRPRRGAGKNAGRRRDRAAPAHRVADT